MAEKVQTINNIPMSNKDIDALNHVYDFLIQMQKAYKETDVLMSPTDGEVVKIEELARVRGILSFFANNQTVEVNP